MIETVIYTIIAGVFLFGVFYAARVCVYGASFRKAAQRLKSDTKLAEEWSVWLENPDAAPVSLFRNPLLVKQAEEYRRDYQQHIFSDKAVADISQYFNAGLVDEIGWSNICDLIPGTLTGLGILGTFIGLNVGIGSIKTSSADEISTGIDRLLGGMGTAFSTSIAGVAAALLFSTLYKLAYRWTLQGLDQFLAAFEERMLDRIERQPVNQLLVYQRQQTELLHSFSNEVANAVSKSMADLMTPVLDRMEGLLVQFGNAASTQQQEGLERIVEGFLQTMNDLLGKQFDELAKTIEEICAWQKKSVAEMQTIVEHICDTSEEIERINQLSAQTVEKMEECVAVLDDFVAQINEERKIAQEQIALSNDVSQRQMECLDRIAGYQERVSELSDHIKAQTDAAQSAVEQLAANCNEQINRITQAAQADMETLSESSKMLSEDSFRRMKSLSEVAQGEMVTLSETSKRIADESHQQLQQLSSASAEQMKALSESTKALSESSHQQIEALSEAAREEMKALSGISTQIAEENHNNLMQLSAASSEQMKALSEAASLLAEESHLQIQTLSETAKDEMQMLSEVSAQLTEDNHRQLQELTQISSDQMGVLAETANKVAENSRQQIEAAVAAIHSQAESLMEATGDYVAFVQTQQTLLVEEVRKEVTGLADFSSRTIAQLDRATSGMEKAADLLDKSMDGALERTFTAFDAGLTEITEHLSGTIADVRDTTETVPHLILQSQKEYEKILQRLEDQTKRYTQSMEHATEVLKGIRGGAGK